MKPIVLACLIVFTAAGAEAQGALPTFITTLRIMDVMSLDIEGPGLEFTEACLLKGPERRRPVVDLAHESDPPRDPRPHRGHGICVAPPPDGVGG